MDAPEKEPDKLAFTHYGWVLFCPIKLVVVGTIGAVIEERWTILKPVLWFAMEVSKAGIFLMSLTNPDYEPSWPIKITGKINGR